MPLRARVEPAMENSMVTSHQDRVCGLQPFPTPNTNTKNSSSADSKSWKSHESLSQNGSPSFGFASWSKLRDHESKTDYPQETNTNKFALSLVNFHKARPTKYCNLSFHPTVSMSSLAKYEAQFKADQQDSLAGLELKGYPEAIRKSVELVLFAVDTIILNRPIQRLVRPPRKERADEHQELSALRHNPDIWLADLSDDFQNPQFPARQGQSEAELKAIALMALYSRHCDHSTIIVKRILKKLLGDEWLVQRFSIWPRHKAIYFQKKASENRYRFEEAWSVAHAVVGLTRKSSQAKIDPCPDYIVDASSLQYGDNNSKRFCTGEDYKNLLNADKDTKYHLISESEDEGVESMMRGGVFWRNVLDTIILWAAADEISSEITWSNLIEAFNTRLPALATEFVIQQQI